MAVYLLIVLLDAASGFGLYRRLVRGTVSLACDATHSTWWSKQECTERIFRSRGLWLLISGLMGLQAAYVTSQLLRTGRW